MPELSRPAAPPSCVADYVTATDPSASSEVTERLDPRESLVAQGSTIATGAAPDLTVADSVKGVITVVAGVCPPAGRAPTPPRRMHKRRVHPDGSVGGAARTREHKEPRAPDPNRKHKPQSVHVQPRRTDSADWGRRNWGMGEQHRVVLGQAATDAVGRAFGMAPPASGRGSGQSSRP